MKCLFRFFLSSTCKLLTFVIAIVVMAIVAYLCYFFYLSSAIFLLSFETISRKFTNKTCINGRHWFIFFAHIRFIHKWVFQSGSNLIQCFRFVDSVNRIFANRSYFRIGFSWIKNAFTWIKSRAAKNLEEKPSSNIQNAKILIFFLLFYCHCQRLLSANK